MEPALTFLAVIGFLAVCWRLFRTVLGALRGGLDMFLARETAEARAQRGDLTGLAEAEKWVRHARRIRRRAILHVAFWVALLVAPALTPWTRALYAVYSVLWFYSLALRERRQD